jgi:hypothetical protein
LDVQRFNDATTAPVNSMGLSAERFKIYRAGAEPVVDGGADAPVLTVFTELGFQYPKTPPSSNRSTRAPAIHPMFESERVRSLSFFMLFSFLHMQQ